MTLVDNDRHAMRFRMLGPLRVRSGDGWARVAAEQPRVVLAVLVAEAGTTVSTEKLIDAVWEDRPPRTASNTVAAYVLRLRRLIGGDVIATRPHGYELVVGEDDVDAAAFERTLAEARRELRGGRVEAGATRLSEALALWSGSEPALADVPSRPVLEARVAHLELLRHGAVEDHMGALLDLGRHAEVVDDLYWLAGEQPLRERRWELLMTALQRCERRADALAAYRRARRVLTAELGVEPGARLRELHQAILAEHPLASPVPAGRPLVVPAQLPADVAGFTGRVAQLQQLDAMVAGSASAVVVSAVDGAAGVGKTALALHWSHHVAGQFPDGQLYVDLRGYAAAIPTAPIEALAMFLRALGVPGDQVPSDVDEASALFRSLLAGKRTLVLLDNAHDAGQVRPLLPASPGCLALVTSRDLLGGLVARDGARSLTLDVLTDAEAGEMLARLLGPARIAAEPRAVGEIARLCGNLPLALRLAAANLTTHPRSGIGEYAARLARDRLDVLEVDGDPAVGVRAAFDLSYAALAPDARRLFRLLGLVPGPDVTVPAAAALADLEPPSASRLLERLAAAHVVDEHRPGRYRLHDLLRTYAAERAVAEGSQPHCDQALARLLRFCLCHADAAAVLLYPEMLRLPRGQDGAPSFRGGQDALAWLDGEHDNLVAAIRLAAGAGQAALAVHLADALRGYLYRRSRRRDWEVVAEAALAAAAEVGADDLRAAAHLNAATLWNVQGRYDVAVEHARAAATAARAAGWPDAEAAGLSSAGIAHAEMGQLDQAAERFTQAVAVGKSTGRTASAAMRLGNLGSVQFLLGRLGPAAASYAEALALHRQAGSTTGLAHALVDLAGGQHALGQYADADATLRSALDLYREAGARRGEANVLRSLAAVRRDSGDLTGALDLAERALAIVGEFEEPKVHADALQTLATIRHHAGQHQRAIDDYRQAIDLARRIGNRFIELETSLLLASAHLGNGQLDTAATVASGTLGLARRYRYRLLEGQATTALAAIRLACGQTDLAADLAVQGVRLLAESGHRLGLARAHLVAGQAMRAAGREAESARHRTTAGALLDEIGADAAVQAAIVLG